MTSVTDHQVGIDSGSRTSQSHEDRRRETSASTIVEWLGSTLPDSRQWVRVLPAAGTPQESPWPGAYQAALRRAAALQDVGIGSGDRVAVLGPTTLPLVETLMATWLVGATSVVLPLPLRFSSPAWFAETTRARIAEAAVSMVFIDAQHADLVDVLPSRTRADVLPPEPPTRRVADPVSVDPAATAILQFTSGSTAGPKAVQLSHRAVTANIRAMGDAAAFSLDDQFVSWLPLYHAMGLLGTLLCPTLFGAGATLLPTSAFMAAPGVWMQAVSAHRGTVTAAPNFAYAIAGRLLPRARQLDLSSLRAAFCGAEPIAPSTPVGFLDNGQPHGLRREAILPCYELAETALAVSFAPLGRPMRVDVVDRAEPQQRRFARPAADPGNEAETTVLVSLGLPLRGTAVRVVGSDGWSSSSPRPQDDQRQETAPAGPQALPVRRARSDPPKSTGMRSPGALRHSTSDEVELWEVDLVGDDLAPPCRHTAVGPPSC